MNNEIVNIMTEEEFFDRFQYDPEFDILGSGGFGTVYKAFDKVKKKHVAIKISQVKGIYSKFTLWNEVKLSEKIDDHVNVARYEFGLRFKKPTLTDYAVMAYYPDGNLDMVLHKRQGILSPKEYYEIVEGLLEGIGHLHTENVIHRDLKLANILMHRTPQGQWRPKITDFGLSRHMEEYDASMQNSAIGITMAYAAPEQIENKPIKKNVDLWAMGVIIYRILTGDMPFASMQGSSSTTATVEISRKITNIELPERLSTLPEPYQTIVRRCWVKDTKERAQTAQELLDILKGKEGSLRQNSYPDTTTTNTAATQPSTAQPQSYKSQKPKSDETILQTDDVVEATQILPPSVSSLDNVHKEILPEVADKTEILQDPLSKPFEDEPKRGVPVWVWGIVGAILLGIAAWLLMPKTTNTPPDPCNISISPDLDCDGDGVLNKNDKCPNEKGQGQDGCVPNKTTTPSGTSNPNADDDKDGVKNAEDLCPTIKGTQGTHGC